MSILDVKNLNLCFKIGGKDYRALSDVSFSLEKGEMLALVGESGCGKTITAMSLLRLLPANAEIVSGQINYNNVNLLNLTEKEMCKIRGKKIALVPQDPMTSLNPLFTIKSQLLEVLNIHRHLYGSEAEKAAIDVLDQVRVPNAKERLNAYPHEFSGGMRQRVVIAIAIACNAEIIIADEPTTALDVTVQAQIMQLLKEIQKERQTAFIFISHDFALVYEAADKACVMYHGEIIEKAQINELFNFPKHPYTKALIKTLPDFNSKKLQAIEGQPPSVKDVFTGCPFESRCNFRMEKCISTKPKCVNINGSCVSCLLFR